MLGTISEATLPLNVISSPVPSPKVTPPEKLPSPAVTEPVPTFKLVPDIAPPDTKLPTFNCPETSPAPFISSEPPSISPLAVIVVAPVIEPLIAKLLPPVIVEPTSNAVPT